MSKTHRLFLTIAVVGLTAAVAGFGVFSAFSSSTTNPGNTFEAGSVTISDNDGSVSLFSSSTKAKPGVNYDKCIRVTYGGSLDATVKLYTSAISADGSKVNVQVDKAATGSQADCSDIGATTNVYAATSLSTFGSTHSSFANGLAVNPGAATKWVASDAVTYRFRMTVPDSNANQGASITPFTLTWEAQNQ